MSQKSPVRHSNKLGSVMAKTSLIQMRWAIYNAGDNLSFDGRSFTTQQVQDIVEKSMPVRPGQHYTEEILAEQFDMVNSIESRWIFRPQKTVES